MKKKISKIWGVGLVVVLLVSMLAFAAPTSAAPLQWSPEDLPSATGFQLEVNDIVDIAVSGDGDIIWVVADNTTIYRSVDGGVTFTDYTPVVSSTSLDANLIAIAPDDSDYVVIADSRIATAYVSSDGGATWGSMGQVDSSSTFTDLDISASYSGVHYVAASGSDGTNASVWYYELGIGGTWINAALLNGFNNPADGADIPAAGDYCLALAFSPSFASDTTLAVVTDNGSATNLELFKINLLTWNASASFTGYPVPIPDSAGTALDTATAASLTLSPTYHGGDEVERVAFVGITATGTD
jgi:hypothetical protein